MMGRRPGDSSVSRLRHEAELALRRSRSRNELEPLLERLEGAAEEGTEPWVFAHRHLAELRLEAHPWRAALHLRQILRVHQNDDVVHALLGLCHALLGNYRVAVASYRRALTIAPQNPWYHHNLGHLLDVALEHSRLAEPHLRTAHQMEPDEDEITASLAHCLARVEKTSEARDLADEALRFAPRNRDHQALLSWIEDGAPKLPTGVTPSRRANGLGTNGRGRGNGGGARPRRGPMSRARSPRRAADRNGSVVQALERGMREAGFSTRQRKRARALWADFREGREVRGTKPEVYAAAIEYALSFIDGVRGATKAGVARRYGISPNALSTRYGEIRQALSLEPGDSRYLS